MQLFGHPLHPALVHFPIAFWTAGSVCDGLVLAGLSQDTALATLALTLGTATALPAMFAGLSDLAGLRKDSQALGTRHMLVMALAWLAYLGALITRLHTMPGGEVTPITAYSCSFAGLILLGVGGWLGGQLVYRHGSGVAHSARRRLKDSDTEPTDTS